MLKRFCVENFKNFKDKIEFNFGNPSNYVFNNEVVKDNTVYKGIIYGSNGSGKSNLALAIFDIIIHLTDKKRIISKYFPYLNLNSLSKEAIFEYEFEFEGSIVLYKYAKDSSMDLLYESLYIDGNEVINYDFRASTGNVGLAGAEKINVASSINSNLAKMSRIRLVRNNAALVDNNENRAFNKFYKFVDNMLMFSSLEQNKYQGFSIESDTIAQAIVRNNKLKDFELFLHNHGLDYNLIVKYNNGAPELLCHYLNGDIPFMQIASSGAKALTVLYYWYSMMSKASFVIIDEFDAFYNYQTSWSIVEDLKKLTNVQILLTTHNTDLLSNSLLRPDVYFQIIDGKITSLAESTQKELREAHNIQKMYKAGAFDTE